MLYCCTKCFTRYRINSGRRAGISVRRNARRVRQDAFWRVRWRPSTTPPPPCWKSCREALRGIVRGSGREVCRAAGTAILPHIWRGSRRKRGGRVLFQSFLIFSTRKFRRYARCTSARKPDQPSKRKRANEKNENEVNCRVRGDGGQRLCFRRHAHRERRPVGREERGRPRCDPAGFDLDLGEHREVSCRKQNRKICREQNRNTTIRFSASDCSKRPLSGGCPSPVCS